MVSLEYRLDRRFFTYRMSNAVAGYGYTKLSADSGSGVSPITQGVLDRSFGEGPEWKCTGRNGIWGWMSAMSHSLAVEAKTSGMSSS